MERRQTPGRRRVGDLQRLQRSPENRRAAGALVAEALNKSHHAKGEHGYGSLVRAVGGVSLHHNLWAHNIARNPRLGDNYGKPPFPTFDVRNNVIYDYGEIAEMTGVSLGTVKSRIHRARNQLQRRLAHLLEDQGMIRAGGPA